MGFTARLPDKSYAALEKEKIRKDEASPCFQATRTATCTREPPVDCPWPSPPNRDNTRAFWVPASRASPGRSTRKAHPPRFGRSSTSSSCTSPKSSTSPKGHMLISPRFPGPVDPFEDTPTNHGGGYRTVSPRLDGRRPPSRELVRMRPEATGMVTEPRGCHTISRSLVVHSRWSSLPAHCGLELTAATTPSRTGRKSGGISTTEAEPASQQQPAQVGSIGPISRPRTHWRSTPRGARRPRRLPG